MKRYKIDVFEVKNKLKIQLPKEICSELNLDKGSKLSYSLGTNQNTVFLRKAN